MNSRLQLRNPPTRINFQSPKGNFAGVARGFNRRATVSLANEFAATVAKSAYAD